MSTISQINQRVKNLPISLQEEVLKFIDYLLFKKQSTEPKSESTSTSPASPSPATFGWAGALKGMDEGLSAVEWQHKISDLMIPTNQPSITQ